MRAIVSAIPDIIFVLDRDGTYLEAFTSRPDLLYADHEDLIGRRLHDVLPKGQADGFLRMVRETIASGLPQSIEYQLDVQAGARWFEGRSAPVDPPDGETHVVFLTRDITVRKQMEEALRKSESRLEAHNVELRQAMSRIETLEGFLSVCSYCRRIRDETDQWVSLEDYVVSHTNTVLSHGACPECFQRAMKET